MCPLPCYKYESIDLGSGSYLVQNFLIYVDLAAHKLSTNSAISIDTCAPK